MLDRPLEAFRADLARLEACAKAYADALVAYALATGTEHRPAFDAMMEAHDRLNHTARIIALGPDRA